MRYLIIVLGTTLLLGVILGSIYILRLATGFYVQRIVDDRILRVERVQNCSGDSCSSKYLVFGEQETYEDVDSIIEGKFNSSDLYGHLQINHSYEFTVIGWRNPFFSWYRNIIKYEEIK
jgi:ssDNA-specific exonuclease RecJ